MKRILGIAMVLGLVGALTVMIGCSKAKEEPPTEKVETKKIDKEGETAAQEINPGNAEVIDLGKDVKLEMILIPAGKFVMGSPASEKGRDADETQHEVTLTKPFYMGKYEVTQEQWESVMGNNPSSRTKEAKLGAKLGAKLPVTDVSWENCRDFIKKLNARTNGGYRLPTEAEWEYACRAGTTTAYSFGDMFTPKDANCDDSKIVKPVVVGSYKANAFGLYDMHGNVWEWCEDWYAKYPDGAVMDPKGPATGERRVFRRGSLTEESRVLRGGSFLSNDSDARSSYRLNLTPADRIFYNGFRLARTP